MTGTAGVPRADGAQLNSHSVSLPTAQEIGWDRGRPARNALEARSFVLTFRFLKFALRAHCGRDARGPSQSLVCLPAPSLCFTYSCFFVLASSCFSKKNGARFFPECIVLALYVPGGLHFLCALLSVQGVSRRSCALRSSSQS